MADKLEQQTSVPIRVMLWFLPRTLSTAVTKCLSFVDDIQIIIEAYDYAYYCGPEGKTATNPEMKELCGNFLKKVDDMTEKMDLAGGFSENICTYDWVKRTLEADYPGKKVIFCKDTPYALSGQFDKLPQGYQHTFIIRHPYKVFPSWRKMAKRLLQLQEPFNFHDLPEPGCPAKYGFEEHYDLYQYLTSKGTRPIVIDADDLQRHPLSIMRQYCEAVGIPFKEDLLLWEESDAIVNTWIAPEGFLQGNRLQNEGGAYDAALKSTCFTPPTEIPTRASLRADLQHMADVSMQFYAKMHGYRIKP